MLGDEPISAGFAAKMVHLPGQPGGEPLFRKEIGSAHRVSDELGNLAVSRLVPAPDPGVSYQICQELVKRNGKKEKNSKSYHGSRRNLNPSCPGISLRPPGQVGNSSKKAKSVPEDSGTTHPARAAMEVKPSPPDRPRAPAGANIEGRFHLPDISDRDHLHRAALVPEGLQELRHALSQNRVPERRRDLVKGLEDKMPLVEPRVGYGELCRGDDLLIEEQEVEIHRPRTPSGAPHSTEITLNGEEMPKQPGSVTSRLHQGNSVDETWLICDAHGLGLVQGGDPHQPAPGKGGETRQGLPACGQPITEIGAEADVGVMDSHGAPAENPQKSKLSPSRD